jgi:HK97 family phage major capsid protein
MTEETFSARESRAVFDAIDDFGKVIAQYRETNDARIASIEAGKNVDVLIDEKMGRLDKAIDDVQRKYETRALEGARPSLDLSRKSAQVDTATREHKEAFQLYMRTGQMTPLRDREGKAMSAASGTDGGFLVPTPAETEIIRRLATISPIRSISSVRQISGSLYRTAFSFQGPSTGWVGESDPRTQTNNQKISDMVYPLMELYAMPAATQHLIDDAAVDIEQWIASEVDTVFAEQEGTAFVKGDGLTKPKGFLSYTNVPQSAWSWGNVGYIATGVAGAFPTSNPSDIIYDLVHSLRAGFRQNGKFVMNRKTQSMMRKFKTTTGEYLWEPPANLGAPATFMNFPVIEAEDMPDIATGSFSLAFGDFQRGYMVIDRQGIYSLRDPYSSKPYVLFYTTKRVGGGILDFDAIKLLKFDVS